MNIRSLKAKFGYCFIVCVLSLPGCSVVEGSHEISVTNPTPELQNSQPDNEPLLLNDLFTQNDKLSYGKFEVAKQSRQINLDGLKVDVLYAVLKKESKIVRKLDGNEYFGAGNSIDFGLFSFLGSGKQLFVSQLVPRGGIHWVVDVSSDGKVIFDSKKYEVGREDFQAYDIDKDGIYEILLPVDSFYGFADYAEAETPLPLIIFKYDKSKREYFPANPEFSDYALRDIESKITHFRSADSMSYLPRILDVVLNYIYAGKEDIAWRFFDKNYDRPDKVEMKTKIINRVKDGSAYKSIYRSRTQK